MDLNPLLAVEEIVNRLGMFQFNSVDPKLGP